MTYTHHYENAGLPLWMRIALYAADHDGVHLDRGQLRAAVDPLTRPAEIARAVRQGIHVGVLHPDSTSRHLNSRLAEGMTTDECHCGHDHGVSETPCEHCHWCARG
jgi:hypothetical protein